MKRKEDSREGANEGRDEEKSNDRSLLHGFHPAKECMQTVQDAWHKKKKTKKNKRGEEADAKQLNVYMQRKRQNRPKQFPQLLILFLL